MATVAFAVAFLGRWFPLGVPGELEYPRLGPWDVPMAAWLSLLPAAAVALAMIGLVVHSQRWIDSAPRRVFLLTVAAVLVAGGSFQMLLEIAAPGGLQKWATLFHTFRHAARDEFADVPSVLTNHSQVAASFEPNHISANPAGWILVYRALLSFFDRCPEAAQLVWRIEPAELAGALRNWSGTQAVPLADQAAVTTVAYLSRLAALLVGLPIAWLVRQRNRRRAALVAMAMAMLVPAATLFAPSVDSVYPAFATLIVALSYYASEQRSWRAAAGAGALIGIGMLFSLSYLVVAAVCALLVAVRTVQGRRPTIAAVIAAPGAWLLVVLLLAAVFGHRAWESWLVNLNKNREFNEYCGCTYPKWIFVNLAELAVALGISAAVFLAARIVAGLARPRTWRSADAVCVAWTLSVTLLALAGTNRGEVARLWLFLMPLAAALSVERLADAELDLRAVVIAGALALQLANGLLLSRELLLFWQWLPHDAAQAFVAGSDAQWSHPRRLTDAEYQRRTGKRPVFDAPGAGGGDIRPGQTVYLWSAREKLVGVASDAQTYRHFARAAAAHDAAALDRLAASQQVALIPQDTMAIVVQRGERLNAVRIVGDREGRVVYVGVDDAHAQKKPLALAK